MSVGKYLSGTRVELVEHNIDELLQGEGVKQMLLRKGEAVKAAALAQGIMVGGEPGDSVLPIVVVEADEADRARVLVVNAHPAALAVEAKHRLLASSLDAAR